MPELPSRAPARLIRSAAALGVACLALVFGGGVAAADPPPLFGNSSDFVDTWRNVDTHTHDVTRVVITPHAGIPPVYVQSYGSCGPDECDWGRVDGFWASTGTDAMKARFFAKNGAGYVFATRKVTLQLESAEILAYQVRTDFADPNRQDYVVSGRLRRS